MPEYTDREGDTQPEPRAAVRHRVVVGTHGWWDGATFIATPPIPATDAPPQPGDTILVEAPHDATARKAWIAKPDTVPTPLGGVLSVDTEPDAFVVHGQQTIPGTWPPKPWSRVCKRDVESSDTHLRGTVVDS